MKSEIVYIEKSNGSDHDGEAWIGKCYFSKTGSSVYFNGKIFRKEKSFSGNHFDIETDENYWISKVKKNGEDRHRFGKGLINIDKLVIKEYLEIINQEKLPKNKFVIVELINIPNLQKSSEIENEKHKATFDVSITHKNIKNLTDKELEYLFEYYNDFDIPKMYKKNRKSFIEEINNVKSELEKRQSNLT